MRQTDLFTKTRKTVPKDEIAKNAQLLIKGGFVHKELAGVYSYLPLGLRVLEKIEQIIREEMNAIGGQEILMSTLQNRELWKRTNRWDDREVSVWLKTKVADGREVGLGGTHEEPLTNIMLNHVHSYQDLPKLIYQIQWKFRNEERARSGVLRGREFLMKDLYSFASSQNEHDRLYEIVAKSYANIFNLLGIGKMTYRTFASGGAFSKYSHEFQCLSEAGEDTIFINNKRKIAINKEVMTKSVLSNLGVTRKELIEKKAIEVGNIFNLGTRYSDALGLKYVTRDGKAEPVIMGCYGIGPTRLMGTIAEVLSDDKGLVWPESVAPFKVHLIELKNGLGKKLYDKLNRAGIEVLYDDRDSTAGEKFNDADLIGIPWRFVVSAKTNGKVECKKRDEKTFELTTYDKVIRKLL